MNINSKIVNFINEKGNMWRDEFEKLYPNVKIVDDGPLSLFKYGMLCNFSDPIVQEARGIIINTETKEVVCWPFRKFGNYYDSYADEIDWDSAYVFQKIDGSMISLWFNGSSNEWQFSTSGTINANDAYVDDSCLTFMEIIKSAENFNEIDFDKLPTKYTYIFELVSPLKRIVIKHPVTKLYLIGIRNNITGEELSIESDESHSYLNIPRPQLMAVSSLSECVKWADSLNRNKALYGFFDGAQIGGCVNEGFVVTDKSFNRVKVKSPIYQMIHALSSDTKKSRTTLLKCLLSKELNVSAICVNHPNLAPIIKYYDFAVEEILSKIKKNIVITKMLHKRYLEMGYSESEIRKNIAIEFKNNLKLNNKLTFIVFKTLNNIELDDNEILNMVDIEGLLKLIPSYDIVSGYML